MNVVTFLISKHFKVYNLYYIQPFFSSMLYFELYKVYDKKNPFTVECQTLKFSKLIYGICLLCKLNLPIMVSFSARVTCLVSGFFFNTLTRSFSNKFLFFNYLNSLLKSSCSDINIEF